MTDYLKNNQRVGVYGNVHIEVESHIHPTLP
nr:MAG TPA: hypothetical protein [Bacteriophage sp.]